MDTKQPEVKRLGYRHRSRQTRHRLAGSNGQSGKWFCVIAMDQESKRNIRTKTLEVNGDGEKP